MFSRYGAVGGYRDVLRISLPLVLSLGSVTVMFFTDRVFLARYSLDAIAACMPAGVAAFLFTCFFMGTVSYVNVFVAQYTGAGRHEEVGPALWQGIWFALGSWVALAAISTAGSWLFAAAGHPPEVVELEAAYFRIVTLGAGVNVLEACISSFYTGRGLTRTVMVVNFLGMCLNVPLDYCMINGVGPFPEMGIAGAALATVISWSAILCCYLLLIFRRGNETRWRVRSGWRFRPALFAKLMRFGLPSGVQFFLDLFAITFFTFLVGRLGTLELAATNVVLALNHLAFLPMVGLSIGVSTMVGQAIGAGRPDEGAYAATSTLHLTLLYMGSMALLFVACPSPLLALFGEPGRDPAVASLARRLLWFVAAYSVVDALTLVYLGALKGAGDIHYGMVVMALAAVCLMVLPGAAALWLDLGIYALWCCLAAYIITLGLVFYRRWRSNRWREFRVIS
ncbi:MATE efflux family protein [Desulfovibrio sp. X2]|uniref:MATE family efflux transporter n=1 Tax=Desulfovibrio sp. X2 TaxID=941449 RepID=UPI000358B1A9|nr:MATE family efflux transporter [Desulfovibrio sp. X2]EPR44503.1 MATE efflux family protein [Desulfovibrio sp. X2]